MLGGIKGTFPSGNTNSLWTTGSAALWAEPVALIDLLSPCLPLTLCMPLSELQAALPVPQSHTEEQDLAKESLQKATEKQSMGTSTWR